MKKTSLSSGFNRILSMVSSNNFATGLISVFVAIYLLEIGYSLQWVIYYLMIHHAVLLLGAFLAVFISNKIGLVRVFILRLFFLIGYLLLLFFLPTLPILFFIIPVLSGLESAFYWTPLNILMVRNTEENTMGKSFSRFLVIPKIISFAAPIVAAFVILQYGFSALFAIAIGIFIFSTLPLLPLESEKTNFIFTWKRAREIYSENKKFFIPEVIDNLAEDAMVFWSILVFLSLSSVFHVGAIASTVAVTSIIFTILLGNLTDNWSKHKLITIGAISLTLAWILNFFIGTYTTVPWIFYVGTIFVSLAMKTFLIPYGSLLYNRARKDDAQFLVLREIPTILGRQILFVIALLFHNNLPIVFLIVGLLFTYFIFSNTRKLSQ
jgi:MFS family permease